MKIALDYDKTYTLDSRFWKSFMYFASDLNFDVRIVTARDERFDKNAGLVAIAKTFPVIYTRGVAKAFHCTHFENWLPDVWIDDAPESVMHNSPATPEWLKEWRATRDEPKPEKQTEDEKVLPEGLICFDLKAVQWAKNHTFEVRETVRALKAVGKQAPFLVEVSKHGVALISPVSDYAFRF